LREMAQSHQNPAARLHALAVLELGLASSPRDIVHGMKDAHPGVRRFAIQLGESTRYAKVNGAALADYTRDAAPQVRMQCALSLGHSPDPETGDLLADLLLENHDDRLIAAAIYSSVRKENCPRLLARLGDRPTVPAALLPTLLKLGQAHGAGKEAARLMVKRYVAAPDEPISADHLHQLAELLDVLGGTSDSLLQGLQKSDITAADRAAHFFGRVHREAMRIALDAAAPVGDKVLAIRVLGRGLGKTDEDLEVLKHQLAPQWPEDVQFAAAQQLGAIKDAGVPQAALASWKSLSPSVRSRVLDTLLQRTEWTGSLLDFVAEKKVLAAEIDTVRRQKLLDHRDGDIRRRAADLFATSSDPDRAKLVSRYGIALPAQADAKHGAKLFEKHCAACHQLGGIGQQVGPELAAVGDKSPEGLLSAILDPNRAVEARYVNYLATTKAGLTVSGLLQGETSTTLTLVAADGKKHDLLRKDIDELTSTGKSVMPEGFEKELPPADMADLIAFLRGHLAKPKSFAGNHPDVVKAGGDGSFKLTASHAAIYGKTLIFEDKFQNLGYWSSGDDQAVWTVDVPKAGRFEVWIDYACDPGAAGNLLALTAANAMLTWKVGSTASWELYRRTKIGALSLAAGRLEIVIRGEGTIRGALIDLRELHLIPAPE
jgi:putative heme-binding domain-containing protein